MDSGINNGYSICWDVSLLPGGRCCCPGCRASCPGGWSPGLLATQDAPVNTHTHTHTRTHTHAYTHTHTHIHTHTYITYTCTHIQAIHMYTHRHTHTRTHAQIKRIYIQRHRSANNTPPSPGRESITGVTNNSPWITQRWAVRPSRPCKGQRWAGSLRVFIEDQRCASRTKCHPITMITVCWNNRER